MPPVIDHPAEGVSAGISPPLTLQVNGEPRSCPPGLQLQQALEALGYRPQLVVVEFNGTIVPRSQWQQQPVVEGDVLEVVTIVGGGS
jgi:sulfur carrier protein